MHTFFDAFGYESETTARAPGRVNLLGEHTDYNDGFVLPTVIPQQISVDIARSKDDHFNFYSANLKQLVRVASEGPPTKGFAQYVYGCIDILRKCGHEIPPVSLFIRSDIPIGSGLSSSAGLEVGVLRALRALFSIELNDVDLALLAQRAEIEYAGVHCGILDQMASSLGREGYGLFLDTRSLETRLLPLPSGADIVIIDSGVPRQLSDTEYNKRRSECESAANALGVKALRDVTGTPALETLPDLLKRRARHVVTENERVLVASRGASAVEFGALMNESHASLRDDYEVSVPALDLLTQLLRSQEGVYGARLTGAGFGGACVALVQPESVSRVKQHVLAEYARAGYHGSVFV